MKLGEYFARDKKEFIRPTPVTGERTDWLDFCELGLKGASILIVDAQFVPSESDGLLVKLVPGNYVVQAQVVNFGGDQRIARLRVFRAGTDPKLAEKLGETWTDTAKTGICDFDTFSQAWGTDADAAYAVIEPFFDTRAEYGMAVLDAARGAVMPFVCSGFGDGTFPVFELLARGARVGFEIEFVAGDENCPGDYTPYQTAYRVGQVKLRADGGDAGAQFELGKMYLSGGDVGKDLAEAAKWFAQASQHGHAEAALKLGLLTKAGQGVPQDYLRARELFELAATRGNAAALNELGILYRHGYGVVADHARAVSYYRQAADLGHANGQYNLAVHCGKGWGIPQSYEVAAKWYRLAADQGHLNSILCLGNLYKVGNGVPKDEAEAVKLYSAGAVNGHALCANNLADSYETGSGVEKDLKKAFIWYALAAGKNVAIAQKSLGMLSKNGEGGVKKNLPAALKWLGQAAENGDAEAHYELGRLYETGEGVAPDPVAACKLYQKAVAGDFAKAGERLPALLASLTDADRADILKT